MAIQVNESLVDAICVGATILTTFYSAIRWYVMRAHKALAGLPMIRVSWHFTQENQDGEATPQLEFLAVNSHGPVPPLVHVASHRKTFVKPVHVAFCRRTRIFLGIVAIIGASEIGISIPKFFRVK